MTEAPSARGLREVSRSSDWWYSKIPPMLSAACATILLVGATPGLALPRLAALLIAICSVAAYGHVINDIFDIDEDRLAGKPNTMAARSPASRTAIALAFAALALGVPWLANVAPVGLILIALNLLLPTLYSLPGIRLKELGVLGVLADAGAAHALPAILFGTAFWPAPGTVPSSVIAATIAGAAFSFLAGLRGIIVHQVHDRPTDSRAGVRTFAIAEGVERSRRIVMRRLLPLEVAALTVFLIAVLPSAPIALGLLGAHAFLEALKMRSDWRLPLFYPREPGRERYLPLLNNELYEVWLPLALAIQLAATAWGFVVLPVVVVLLFLENIRTRVRALRTLRLQVRPTSRVATRVSIDRRDRPPVALHELNVILGASYWTLNGVNVFSMNLARGLQAAGARVRILVTEEDTCLVRPNESPMRRPSDLAFERLPTRRADCWGAHWGAMIRYLEENAPCVYVPNSDWRHSCVVPLLSPRVAVAGVVHSDDPLHYDHVRRLGPYWDAIVCVSDAVSARTRALLPDIADSVRTIPIGVVVPDAPPARVEAEGTTLTVVYNGILKQHQKRVLDLPEIVRACVARGVPVRLTVAGGGPDERALREACADLVTAGLVKFVGVVAREDVAALLVNHDVFIMMSEFEGMPNALLEAMGQGCVPLVTAIESGASQVLRPGENGLTVPVGDYAAFADSLYRLHADHALRARLGHAAHATAREGYRLEQMVASYQSTFQQLQGNAAAGVSSRRPGVLSHPPAQIAGVSVFPPHLAHDEPGVGRFISRRDSAAFWRAVDPVRQTASPPLRGKARLGESISLQATPVIVGAPIWARNGVNEMARDMVRVLRTRNIDARVLLTEEETDLVAVDEPRLAPSDAVPIEHLPVARTDGWGAHWGTMIRYLEDRAPCIYLSAYDWRHAMVIPRLSRSVRVVGLVAAADPLYFDNARRTGGFWDAAIAFGADVSTALAAAEPKLLDRIVQVDQTLPIPADPPQKPDQPLSVLVYPQAGCETASFTELLTVLAGDVDISVTIVVQRAAPEAGEWRSTASRLHCAHVETGALESERSLLTNAHVLIAPGSIADRELLVAMGHACIPLVVGNPPSLAVRENETAFVVPPHQPEIALELLRGLMDVRRRTSMALAAFDEVVNRWSSEVELTEQMVDVLSRVRSGELRRRKDGPRRLLPPPARVAGTDIFPVPLPCRLWGVGRFPSAEDARAFRRSLGSHADVIVRASVFVRHAVSGWLRPSGARRV